VGSGGSADGRARDGEPAGLLGPSSATAATSCGELTGLAFTRWDAPAADCRYWPHRQRQQGASLYGISAASGDQYSASSRARKNGDTRRAVQHVAVVGAEQDEHRRVVGAHGPLTPESSCSTWIRDSQPPEMRAGDRAVGRGSLNPWAATAIRGLRGAVSRGSGRTRPRIPVPCRHPRRSKSTAGARQIEVVVWILMSAGHAV